MVNNTFQRTRCVFPLFLRKEIETRISYGFKLCSQVSLHGGHSFLFSGRLILKSNTSQDRCSHPKEELCKLFAFQNSNKWPQSTTWDFSWLVLLCASVTFRRKVKILTFIISCSACQKAFQRRLNVCLGPNCLAWKCPLRIFQSSDKQIPTSWKNYS